MKNILNGCSNNCLIIYKMTLPDQLLSTEQKNTIKELTIKGHLCCTVDSHNQISWCKKPICECRNPQNFLLKSNK